MLFKKKRGDTEIGNISYLPDDIKDKYRDDMHLKTLLDHENATSLNQLLKKRRSKC